MLIQHSMLYAVARGVPAIFNFLAIFAYTRMLTPGAYGEYALVIAAISLLESVIFRWLSLGVLRFLPHHKNNPEVLLSVAFFTFFSLISLTLVIAILMVTLFSEYIPRNLILITVALLWASAWYELNLQLARSKLSPKRYGLISILKSILSLSIGILLVFYGFNAYGPLTGLLVGMLVSSIALMWREWRIIGFRSIEKELFVSLIRYGLPLAATFSLTFVVNSSDRFLLTWFLGAEAAGLYSPGYDIAQRGIGILMTIVNLAAYPLAIRALEEHGEAAARVQLRNNGLLLLTVSLPASIGFIICAPNIANVLLGEAYRLTAVMLIPWIALSAIIGGFKSFYLDLSFQLGRSTIGQFWTLLTAASINLILNLWWIPTLGLIGAAYATLVAYLVSFVMSFMLGRKVFKLPALPWESYKVVVATAIMAALLVFTTETRGALGLLVQIAAGGTIYVAVIIALNLSDIRNKLIYFTKIPGSSGRFAHRPKPNH